MPVHDSPSVSASLINANCPNGKKACYQIMRRVCVEELYFPWNNSAVPEIRNCDPQITPSFLTLTSLMPFTVSMYTQLHMARVTNTQLQLHAIMFSITVSQTKQAKKKKKKSTALNGLPLFARAKGILYKEHSIQPFLFTLQE